LRKEPRFQAVMREFEVSQLKVIFRSLSAAALEDGLSHRSEQILQDAARPGAVACRIPATSSRA
jgi:hypothetical protein